MPWHGDLRAQTGVLLTREQELIVKGYPGSVGLMRSIPPSVEKTEEGLSKAL